MLIIFFIVVVSFLVSIIIIMLSLFLREKSKKEREKLTPFECGFSPFKKARRPFSLRFFIITLIFLIFDIELALLLPLGILKLINFLLVSAIGLIITIILVGGLLHEWKQGALSWIK